MRLLDIRLVVLFALGSSSCGPISDWPHNRHDDNEGQQATTPVPVTTPPPVRAGDAGTAGPTGDTPPPISGSVDAGFTTAPPAGGSGGDAGAVTSATQDAGAPSPDLDAAAGDADGSLPSGDGGSPEGGCAVRADGGSALQDDGGDPICSAYGCRTLRALSAASREEGACATATAIARACDGYLGRATAQCTQDNVFSAGLTRAVSVCLAKDPQLQQVPAPCLECFAGESLCTLSRCFVACIDGRDPSCQQCRRQQCGQAFSMCSGLPTP